MARCLAWAFAGCLCDKYHNLMSWLIIFKFDWNWVPVCLDKSFSNKSISSVMNMTHYGKYISEKAWQFSSVICCVAVINSNQGKINQNLLTVSSMVPKLCDYDVKMSQLMRLWYFLPSENSFFRRAYAAIQCSWMSDFWSDSSLTSILYVCEQGRLWRDCVDAQALMRLRRCAGSPEPSVVASVISTIMSWAGSNNPLMYRGLFCTYKLDESIWHLRHV